MDLDDTPEQAAYRAQVRSWLDEHKAEAPILQGPGAIEDEDEIVAARRAWQGKLAEGGLAGVTWPKDRARYTRLLFPPHGLRPGGQSQV